MSEPPAYQLCPVACVQCDKDLAKLVDLAFDKKYPRLAKVFLLL